MTTVDAATWFERERRLRHLYHNTVPFWEDPTGGAPYVWAPSQFALATHTADPTDSGNMTSSESMHLGYVRTLHGRDSSNWELINPQTGTPAIRPLSTFNCSQNTSGGNINIAAFSLGLRHSAVDYPIWRSVPGSPLVVADLQNAQIPQTTGALIRSDSGGTGTAGANFDSWETLEAKYLFWGDSQTYALPGMTINCPNNKCYVGLSKSDPRQIVYPNEFALAGLRNATYEPDATEWNNYHRDVQFRNSTSWTYTLAAGTVTMENALGITFPVPGVASTGCSLPWATISFPSYNQTGFVKHYILFAIELDTPIVIPAGGGNNPTIPAGDLVIEFDTP